MSRPFLARGAVALGLALLLLGTALPLAAQSAATAGGALLLPPRFFVGDRVELRLRLEVGESVTVSPPTSLPQSGDPLAAGVRIDRVEVSDRGPAGRPREVLVRVFFTPFVPGTSRLPELRLGGLVIPPQEITTASVREVEAQPRLRPLRGQLLLPYARLRLVLTVLALLGAPAAGVFASLWALRGLRKLRELRRRRLPALHLRRALQRLEQGLPRVETREYFVRLSGVLKTYLQERLGLPALSSTTAELEGLLGAAGLERELTRRVQGVLRTADRSKFSGRTASRGATVRTLQAVREIAAGIEEHYVES